MSDEAPERDTPPEADTPEVDWQKRYSDLQPEYTRATQALKEHEQVWEDQESLLARIAETHPHLLAEEQPDEEPEPEWDEDDQIAPLRSELEEFKAWRQSIDSERGSQRFEADLKGFAGDRDISSQGKDWIAYRTSQTGNNSKALEKATGEWFEYEDSLKKAARDEYLKTKRAPSPPKPGTAGEEQRNPRDRNARRAQMAAAIAAEQQE